MSDEEELDANCPVMSAVVRCDQWLRFLRWPLPRPTAAGQHCAAAEGDADTLVGRSACVDPVNREALAEYFREAASWDADRLRQVKRMARRAWQVAAAGWISALALTVALVVLMPLKRVDP